MPRALPQLTDEELIGVPDEDEPGFGALDTPSGRLPLQALDVSGRIDGLMSQLSVRQTFINSLDVPLEATYIFPLPDRAAVRGFRMEIGGRIIEGVIEERARAREDYDRAVASGQRAAIAEEERPNVFTLRVGNIMPGETATVQLDLAGVLPYSHGEVTFRFPLVVAPRYVPGAALPGSSVGDGTAVDTDAVPDASRISPPVLLRGFPNPVRLALAIDLYDPGGCVVVDGIRSSLHAILTEQKAGCLRIQVEPGNRLDRDFILRFRLGSREPAKSIGSTLTIHPDNNGDGQKGTFALTLVPPGGVESLNRPRDVVFVLDRSGSMEGWKIVAARRAMARMVDTLGESDRFAVLAFDNAVETPPGLALGLLPATDRNRFRTLEYLAKIDARGGTEMAEPLVQAADRLTEKSPRNARLGSPEDPRDRILVLVTDGQVGNEDQILQTLNPRLRGVRVFALGIDRAVNEAFLRRLAELGGGHCELVESEGRLDEVMTSIHRQIGTPLLTGLELESDGFALEPESLVPERLPDLFPGAPLLVLGRYQGRPVGQLRVRARDAAGLTWTDTLETCLRDNPAIAAAWARGQVRKLEDRYVVGRGNLDAIERHIIAVSLRFGVLSRFTAYVAIDRSEPANTSGRVHRITQPVEMPQRWGKARFAGNVTLSISQVDCYRLRSRPFRAPAPPVDALLQAPDVDSLCETESLLDLPMLPPSPMTASAPPPDTTTWAESLDLVLRGRLPSPHQAARWVAEIAEAIQHAHEQGFDWCDITPADISIQSDGQAVIADPLRLMSHAGPVDRTLSDPAHVAPERLEGVGAVDHARCAVYSLGVILYKTLAGVLPFEGGGLELIRRILHKAPRKPRAIRRSIPEAIQSICLKAMARKPDERYATPGELARVLREVLEHQPERKKSFWKRK